MVKQMPLTQGKFALVDDEDFEYLSQWKWSYCGRRAYRHDKYGTPKNLAMHRVLTNAQPHQHVDHINLNPLDNRKCNLRLCTRSQNQANVRPRKNTTSKYKGVSWKTALKRWVVYVTKDGKQNYVGVFKSEEEAALAYNKKASELFGEFALLNIIESPNKQEHP